MISMFPCSTTTVHEVRSLCREHCRSCFCFEWPRITANPREPSHPFTNHSLSAPALVRAPCGRSVNSVNNQQFTLTTYYSSVRCRRDNSGEISLIIRALTEITREKNWLGCSRVFEVSSKHTMVDKIKELSKVIEKLKSRTPAQITIQDTHRWLRI